MSGISKALPLPIQIRGLDEDEPLQDKECTFQSRRALSDLSRQAMEAVQQQDFRQFEVTFKGGRILIPCYQWVRPGNAFEGVLSQGSGKEIIPCSLRDVQERTVRLFTRYCLGKTQTLPLSAKDLVDLYELGDNLQDEDLKRQALQYLAESPNVEKYVGFLLEKLIERGTLENLPPSIENFLCRYCIWIKDQTVIPKLLEKTSSSRYNPVEAALMYIHNLVRYDKNCDSLALAVSAGTGPIGLGFQADCFLKRHENSPHEEDALQAFQMAQEAEAKGSLVGKRVLARCYERGYGTPKDSAYSLLLNRVGGERGNPFAMQWLAEHYENRMGHLPDPVQAFHWYKEISLRGNLTNEVMVKLGSHSENGTAGDKNLLTAFYWYERAANEGNGEAACHLGRCHEFGLGVEKNMALAVHWYAKAASLGNGQAYRHYGRCQEQGLGGTEKNVEEAFYWYKKSAELDYRDITAYDAARCYEHGIGTRKDPARAFWLYKRASVCYDAAALDVGRCYLYGIGTEENPERAFECFTVAARDQNPLGVYFLGLCHLRGKGTPVNREEAHELLSQASRDDVADALMVLANEFYEGGDDTRYNPQKALEFYRRALAASPENRQESIRESITDLERRIEREIKATLAGIKNGESYARSKLSGLKQQMSQFCFEIKRRSSELYCRGQIQGFFEEAPPEIQDAFFVACSSAGLTAYVFRRLHHTLTHLNLTSCADMIDDADLICIVQECRKLQALDISHCHRLTDASIKEVAKNCRDLRSLNAKHCKGLTDRSLDLFKSRENFKLACKEKSV